MEFCEGTPRQAAPFPKPPPISRQNRAIRIFPRKTHSPRPNGKNALKRRFEALTLISHFDPKKAVQTPAPGFWPDPPRPENQIRFDASLPLKEAGILQDRMQQGMNGLHHVAGNAVFFHEAQDAGFRNLGKENAKMRFPFFHQGRVLRLEDRNERFRVNLPLMRDIERNNRSDCLRIFDLVR